MIVTHLETWMEMTCVVCEQPMDEPGLQCGRCRNGEAVSGRAEPSIAPLRKPDAPAAVLEKDVEAGIIAMLELHGWDVTKTSIRAHPKGATAGTPDLYVRRGERRVWIEVKRPGRRPGKVRDAQARWHDRERAAGGEVIVAYGIEDVAALLAA